MWKVYNIQSGRIVKGGFISEDEAKDWVERRRDLPEDEHDVDEMDEEEEEEYIERAESGDEDEADLEAGSFESDYESEEVDPTGADAFVDDGFSVIGEGDDDDY